MSSLVSGEDLSLTLLITMDGLVDALGSPEAEKQELAVPWSRWEDPGRTRRTPVFGGLAGLVWSRFGGWTVMIFVHVMFWLTEYRLGPVSGPYLIQFWKSMMWYDSFL